MSQVYRCYTEKLPAYAVAAQQLLSRLKNEDGVARLEDLRILHRYDVEGVDELTYASAVKGVFSEPACDAVFHEQIDIPHGWHELLIEALPGQFDQRADSCEQCIAMITQRERPRVRYAAVYLLKGELTQADFNKIRAALINPVESREASGDKPATLKDSFPEPENVPVLHGLTAENVDLKQFLAEYSLAMDEEDLRVLRDYFRSENRDPTLTELKMIDTYWSDHCRHTTFLTELDERVINYAPASASFDEYILARRELYGDKADSRPVTLMDIATCGAKILKKRGILQNLDESEEVNACSVRVIAEVDGKKEPWLLMFKNETHNHPTEIEPFGGAATCLGGAIRDPLSGRAYVYQAMRLSGAADPRLPLEQTLPGKLPQRVICRSAAAGYSSYGNQIGLATGLVSEVYHPGYMAKRFEAGAVIAAAPEGNVRREVPAPGDAVILLGGRTGRDGCGGATGSSKSHSADSLLECGAEVQKGNAPEERKIQRLFRNPAATTLIKRCNDFGAGGVSVAVGELADGLDIDLDKVPKKYDGLNGTELAISESQERMAVVLAPEDVDAFCALALEENLECSHIATVTESPRLVMRWRGEKVCDISREFLNSNGAKKRAAVAVLDMKTPETVIKSAGNARERALDTLKLLSVALQKGLGTMFDGSVGASSVLMPFGGANQLTPAQVMAATLPALHGQCTTASVMSWGFDPDYSAQNPYIGAQATCLSAAAKLAAAGCDTRKAYFSFQEFFEKPNSKAERLGKPFAALLGAFSAQTGLGIGAIGGKDSMSGTFDTLDVPPTLAAFAVSTLPAQQVLSPEFRNAEREVWRFAAGKNADGTYDFASIRAMYDSFFALCERGEVEAAWAVSAGGIIEAVCKMAIGNDIGFETDSANALFELDYGGIVAQLAPGAMPVFGEKIGRTIAEPEIRIVCEKLTLDEVKTALEAPLARIYPPKGGQVTGDAPQINFAERNLSRPFVKTSRPRAVIPTFPGTNCEYDTKRAVELAGGEGEIVIVRNLTPELLKQSAKKMADEISRAQMLIFPGGFSGGDEPEGSGKFIQALFRAPELSEAVMALLERQGLILGICNGFQALIKLGLLPFGKISELDETCPTLTYNAIGRHQSIYANTRVASVKSPWLSRVEVGEVYKTAFSHGEGRFMASAQMLEQLAQNGQIALQYCDAAGHASMDGEHNINGSAWAVEAVCSPDGRVLGKMGHVERHGKYVAKNIPGEKYMPLFKGGVEYFTK